MKKLLLLFFFVQLSILSFAQKKKIYLNDDLIEISKKEFKQIKNKKEFYDLKFELDSLIAIVKVQRIKKGKISKSKLDTIRTVISKQSFQNIPKTNTIVINYHHQLDECNSSGTQSYIRAMYKSYLNKIEKQKNVSQFFMYKTIEGTDIYGNQLNWIEDYSGIIEKTFLPLNYPCGSFVLINDKGNFYVYKGEYFILEILSLLKNKTTFSN